MDRELLWAKCRKKPVYNPSVIEESPSMGHCNGRDKDFGKILHSYTMSNAAEKMWPLPRIILGVTSLLQLIEGFINLNSFVIKV